MSAGDNHSLPGGAPFGTGFLALGSRSYWRDIRPLLALLVIALVYFYRLDRPLLWGDEADTGIAARSILRHDYPLEYDGRNLSVFQNGAELNRNLVRIRVSWGQFYVGALSMALFGNNAGGLRLLFAIIGLLAFFPLHAVLKPRVKYPDIIAALVLTAPQIVLFQRNARYYSMLILLYAALVWLVSAKPMSERIRSVLASLVFILLFHTQSFAAVCCGASLIAFSLLFDRKSLLAYCVSSGIGLLSWFAWHEALGPPIVNTPLPISLIESDPAAWGRSFGAGLLATIVDLDAVACLPILLWVFAIAALFWRGGRQAVLDNLKQPLPSLILINILIQTVATAALFGSETAAQYAILRYMPHLMVFALVSCFVVLDAAIPSRRLYVPVCVGVVALNAFTLTFWAKPYSRQVPLSWLPPVYCEVFRPPVNPWDVIVAKIRRETLAADNHDRVITSVAPWAVEAIIFYLGDSYLTPPPLDETGRQTVCAIIGEKAFLRFCAQPEWVLDTVGVLDTAPPGYITYATVPSYRVRPDDGTRPELTRHTFPQRAVVGHVTLFRRQSNRS